MMSGQHVAVLLVLSLFGVLLDAGVSAHGGNYDRRYYRFLKPSWSYGGHYGSRGRGGGGPGTQFGNIGKQAGDFEVGGQTSDPSFDVRSSTGDGPGFIRGSGFPGDYYGGTSFPGDYYGGGGVPGDFFRDSVGPEDFFGDSGDHGGRFPGGRLPGRDNIEVTKVNSDLVRDHGQGGICPPVRISCTAWRSRQENCQSDSDCAPRRKCCFDTCLQNDVCKTPI